MLMERRVLLASGGFGAKCTTQRAIAKTYRPHLPERDTIVNAALKRRMVEEPLRRDLLELTT